MCGDREGVNYFDAPYNVVESSVPPEHSWSITDIGNGQSKWCVGGYENFCHDRPKTDYEIEKKFLQMENDFQQTAEYLGRNGDILSFVYTEFNENMARPSFNRNFQVDLSEGNTVNFKGAEIEIIEADNLQVTYVINKYFGGAE